MIIIEAIRQIHSSITVTMLLFRKNKNMIRYDPQHDVQYIKHNTIQYNTIQYNTILYNTKQYNTIQYNTIQYNTIQYNTIQYNTIQYKSR